MPENVRQTESKAIRNQVKNRNVKEGFRDTAVECR